MAKAEDLRMKRGKDWMSHLVRGGNRFIDRLLSVNDDTVLNTGEASLSSANPAQALFQAAKTLKAEAIDPETGRIDYMNLAKGEAYRDFREVAQSLANCNLEDLGDKNTQTAFWINLYNALILDAVVQYQIKDSISRNFSLFRRAAYRIGGMRFSADDIEHGILRGNRRNPYIPLPLFASDDPRLAFSIDPPDPRIHFALVCGARSCPPIAFYDGEKINAQLDLAAAGFINGGGADYDPINKTLWLSKIFSWYQVDFGGRQGVLKTIRKYSRDEGAQEALERVPVRIRYQPYDWSVNGLV
jgi:hypothetical protein